MRIARLHDLASQQKSPRLSGGFFYDVVDRLSNSVLEGLTGFERWDLHRWDGDLLPWVARIHTRASSTLGHAERAEARDRNRVTLLQLLRDQASHSLESVSCSALGNAGSVRDIGDKVLLGHRRGRKMVKQTTACSVLSGMAVASHRAPSNGYTKPKNGGDGSSKPKNLSTNDDQKNQNFQAKHTLRS